MKPLIGIAPLFDDERNSIWMLPDYMNAIRHAGGVPVILPLEGTSEDICAAASVCSGFVLTGGQDVDPKIYGEKPLPQCGTPNETRDQTDYLILCYAMEHNLPLNSAYQRGARRDALAGSAIADRNKKHAQSAASARRSRA